MNSKNTALQFSVDEIKSLTEAVYEKIKNAIVHDELKAGSRISERMLAEKLGVSSTTVKRALQRLHVEGLVEIQPRKGTYVVESFCDSMEENTIMRAYLEGLAARFAAQKATEEAREELRRQIEVMRERTTNGPVSKIVEANSHFHYLIHEAGKNPYVGRLIEVIKNFDQRFRDQALSDHGEAVRGFQEHLAVYEAVMARDGELAEDRMRKHILRTLDFVTKERK